VINTIVIKGPFPDHKGRFICSSEGKECDFYEKRNGAAHCAHQDAPEGMIIENRRTPEGCPFLQQARQEYERRQKPLEGRVSPLTRSDRRREEKNLIRYPDGHRNLCEQMRAYKRQQQKVRQEENRSGRKRI
jgi:hypothetical protein